jgi:hypothetical protein
VTSYYLLGLDMFERQDLVNALGKGGMTEREARMIIRDPESADRVVRAVHDALPPPVRPRVHGTDAEGAESP